MWPRALVFVILAACSSPDDPPAAYDGTVILGDGYVQVLATGPGDRGCPPRIHRAGTCVRTPTAPGTCADEPACITRLSVGDASVAGTYLELDAPLPSPAALVIEGCGGTFEAEVATGDAVAPFDSASATPAADQLQLSWQPAGGADQVCALWSWDGFRELCCAADTGSAAFALPAGVELTSVRLSRGDLVATVPTDHGRVDVYRTAETAELLP